MEFFIIKVTNATGCSNGLKEAQSKSKVSDVPEVAYLQPKVNQKRWETEEEASEGLTDWLSRYKIDKNSLELDLIKVETVYKETFVKSL